MSFAAATGRDCRPNGLAAIVTLLATAAAIGCGQARHPNVLLITVDTLRADRLGTYGSRVARTPVVDRLASEGLLVEHAFTSVPVTLASHATLLTGRLPPQHGVRGNSFYRLAERETTLAELLKRAGYRTGAVVGAAVLDRRFGLDQGFDVYDDQTPPRTGGDFIAERDATAVVSRAIEWLTSRPDSAPFFLWVHLFDPHDPYRPPEPYASRFASSPYDGEVAHVDAEVGRLLGALDAQGLRGRTLTVFTSDHGESFGEHGEATHGVFLYDSTLRVPLIVAGPGVPRERRGNDEPVGLVDVMPTILARVGLPPPAGLAGHDLLGRDVPPREFLYAETFLPRDFYNWSELRALRSARLKFVQAPALELYDIANDPDESENLAPQREAEARRLASLLPAAALDSTADSPAADSRVTPDSDLAERLRSLGYVGGSPLASDAVAASKERPNPKDRIAIVARLDEALALVAAGRLAEATDRLESILASDPTNYLALRTLADALFDQSRDEESLAAYRRAMVSHDAPYDHYRLGLLHERRREYQQAAVEFGSPRAPESGRCAGDSRARRGAAADGGGRGRAVLFRGAASHRPGRPRARPWPG